MDCSTLGFPVHHQLPELTQTHVHQVGDTIQPSHPLSSPSPPAFSLSQNQGKTTEHGLKIGSIILEKGMAVIEHGIELALKAFKFILAVVDFSLVAMAVIVIVQSLSHIQTFVTSWTAARQSSLSITNSWSLLKLMSIESVMPSNHLILCPPLLLLGFSPVNLISAF